MPGKSRLQLLLFIHAVTRETKKSWEMKKFERAVLPKRWELREVRAVGTVGWSSYVQPGWFYKVSCLSLRMLLDLCVW